MRDNVNAVEGANFMTGELIVAVFPSRAALTRALDKLMEVKTTREQITHAAIVAKAESGEVIVLDDDIGADEGGVAGGTLGAAMAALGMVQLGALAIPGIGAIIAVGAGALVGGLIGRFTGRVAAQLIDKNATRNTEIEGLAENLRIGHPALVLEVRNMLAVFESLKEQLINLRAERVEQWSGDGEAAEV
jgi:hypothetical protein